MSTKLWHISTYKKVYRYKHTDRFDVLLRGPSDTAIIFKRWIVIIQ